jgi:hypothetical protein
VRTGVNAGTLLRARRMRGVTFSTLSPGTQSGVNPLGGALSPTSNSSGTFRFLPADVGGNEPEVGRLDRRSGVFIMLTLGGTTFLSGVRDRCKDGGPDTARLPGTARLGVELS